MRIFLSTQITDASIERGAVNSARHFARLMQQVTGLKSFDALMVFVQKIPASSSAMFGQELSKAMKENFIKGVQQIEKQKRQTLDSKSGGVSFSYELQFKEAIEHFQLEAFEVATVTNLELMKRLREEALVSLREGKTFADFKRNVPTIFQSFGVSPAKPHHLKTNYDTGINGSYMAGQWKRLQSMDYTHLKYMSVGDSHVRPAHKAMHGKVYPTDSNVWDRWYPPNGWNCRCYIEPLNAEREKFTESPESAANAMLPDQDFETNPGKTDSIFGKYLRLGYGEQIAGLNYKSYGLPEWKDVPPSGPAPKEISRESDKTDAEMLNEFRKEFSIVDFERNIVKVIDSDFNHVFIDGDRNRFRFLPFVC